MLDWKVLEEGTIVEELPPPPRPPRRTWWLAPLLALCLLALGVGLGSRFWQNKQQEEQLRRDLTDVIEAEARAQAFGLVEQVGTFADTSAPPNWRLRYLHLFELDRRSRGEALEWVRFFYFGIGLRRNASGLPVLQGLALEEEGQRASVEIAWDEAGSVIEQRAYRFVEGRWRRTPLQGALGCSWESGSPITYQFIDGQWQSAPCEGGAGAREVELSFPSFALRGQEADLLPLNEPGAFYLGLDGLRAHLEEQWPEPMVLDRFITLTVRSQEFNGPVLEERPSAAEASILLNAPASTRLSPEVPLASGAQYRLIVTNVLLFTLLDHRQLNGLVEGANLVPSLLVQAEARRWALTAEEQRTLRNAWRAELGGQWHSPLVPAPATYRTREEAEVVVRYWLSWHLLLEWLIEDGYIDSPGALARTILERPALNPESLLTQLTGLSGEALDNAARTYALTLEP